MFENVTFPEIAFATRDGSASATLAPNDWPEATKQKIWAYGVNRWFQDYINSQANIAKKADVRPDHKAYLAKRIEMAANASFGSRGTSSGKSDFDRFEDEIVTKHWKLWKKVKTYGKKKEVWFDEVKAELVFRKGGAEDYELWINSQYAEHLNELAAIMGEVVSDEEIAAATADDTDGADD